MNAVGPFSDPRAFRLLSVSALRISSSQRPVNPTRVARMAAKWKWEKAEAITVSARPNEPGIYDVIEGQNRTMALRQIDPDAMVLCVVLQPMTRPEQAGTALGIGEGRSPLTAIERFYLRYTKGDAHVLAAQDVLTKHSIKVDNAQTARHTRAASAVMTIVQGTGRTSPDDGAEALDDVLDTLLKAWPHDPTGRDDRLTADIIGAVGVVLGKGYDKKDVVKALKRKSNHPGELAKLSGSVSKRDRIVRHLLIEVGPRT